MPFAAAVNQPHNVQGPIYSVIGVIGTLGTADVSGTAQTLPIGVEAATGAMYVKDLSAATGTQSVSGTVVVSNVAGGTVVVSNIATGTIALGTVKITDGGGNIIGGRALANATPMNVAINDQSGNHVPSSKNVLSYGTVAAGTLGTLVNAAGVGTPIYVQSFSIDGDVTALGTPDVVLSFGTVQSGAGVIFRGALPTTTPFGQAFAIPVNANVTNTPLTFMQLSGGGTIAWNITYFVGI